MVELRDVTKRFDTFEALKCASFEIKAGEFMTFLGPSGCGKTTCLRLISGFDSPTSGQILIDGRDVTLDPPYRRDVNQVFQNYALFPHLTIYENIAFGLRMKRVPAPEIKKRVERVIQMTSLEAFVDRKPAQMSGGQRQRVALARAIICEPKVLLLDEPLSALDAKLRTQMRGELKQLQKKLGITFIFVTHDQEEALAMSDRVAVINEGHVEQIGTVHEIYYQPATRFVASFIGETNIIEAEVTGADATHTLCRVEGGLTLRIPISPTPVGSKILLSLRPEKVRLHRADTSDRNSFPARISREVFKGAVDDITLVTEAGLELGALLPNDGQTERDFHEGEPIFASIRPEDINIIKA
ncbi:ABC transporter ATP-binding protein [bacterium]|nr:ABC transporter ATP-binding protein [bacterium]NBS51914.1 ABC transporter ATP-binding protein [Spartobacteria bacterium]